MTVCRNGFHNGVMTYMLQIGECTIHRIFMTLVVFVETIFSCINLKHDDGFLPCYMPEVFNKNGH